MSSTRGASNSTVAIIAIATIAIGLGAAIGLLWGFLATLLRSDLGLSRTQIGLLVGIYFGSTGLASVAGGTLTDRFGARLAVVSNMLLVAVAATAVVAIPRYATMLVASVLAGAGYALANAGTNAAIAASVPLGRRAVALTVKTSGSPMSAVLGAMLGPWAGDRFGWATVFTVVAIIAGFGVAASWLVLPADRPSRSDARPSRSLPRGFYLLPVASFLLILGSQPLMSWIVAYLDEGVGMTTAASGQAAGLTIAMGVAGMILIARHSDAVGARKRFATVAFCAMAAAVGVFVTAAGVALGAGVAIIGAVIGSAGQLGAVGVLHAAVVDVAPDAVGRASGVTMTGYYVGALAGPTTFGAIVDWTGSYPAAWTAAGGALMLSALAFQRAGSRLTASHEARPE